MSGLILLCLVWALAALPPSLGAQLLSVRRYTHADGLPQIQIYDLHQDARGYIWLGSNAGLSRYDGRIFHSLSASDGLASNTVSKIRALPSGDLVVAAGNFSVCVVHPEPVDIRCTGIYNESGGGGQLNDLLVDSRGGIWVGTYTRVSHIVDGTLVRVYDEGDGLPGFPVYALEEDGSGTIWAGTEVGLARLGENGWERIWPESGEASRVAALSAGPHGLLLGTDRGLLALEDQSFRTIPLGQGDELVRTLAQTPDGEIWAEVPGSLYRWQDGDVTRFDAANGVPSGEIFSILVDRERNVWLGSGTGLWKFPQSPFQFFTEQDGLPNSFVRAMATGVDGRLYLGTRGGLGMWDGTGFSEIPLPSSVPDPRIWSMTTLSSGDFLLGTTGGLIHLDAPGRGQLFRAPEDLPSNSVFSLLPWGRESALVGAGGNVRLWRDGAIHPAPPPLDGDAGASVLSLIRDSRDRIWMGLGEGGVLVAEGDSLHRLGRAQGLSDQTVWSLAPDSHGGVWVGTNGDGAFHVTDAGTTRYTSEDGLGNDFVWQVLVDSREDVWFFTGLGINRLSDGRMIYYGQGEGLVDLEGAATAILEDRDGMVWFGTGTGVYRYDPDQDLGPPPPPRVYLESVQAGGAPFEGEELSFPPGTGSISFRFSAPSYRDEESMRFRSRLAGREEEWSEPSSDPTSRFVELGPGSYILEVEAVSGRGLQTSDPLVVPFRVEAPLWQAWWFQLSALVVLVVALSRIPALRARHHEAERARLEKLVAERTREIRANALRLEQEIQERKEAERAREHLESQLRQAQKMEAVGRLAGGIAHDFNNLLTTVLGYTELMAADAKPDSELGKDLEEIKRVAQKGAALVSQLLAFSRKQVVQWQPVDMGTILEEMAGMISRVVGPRVKLEMELPGKTILVRGDPNQLSQVVMNLAVNARDAMPSGGRLLVAATECALSEPQASPVSDTVPPGRYARIVVSDTGEGMDDETIRRAFEPFFTTKDVGKGSGLGLASVYGIVHQHKGFIQVSAAPGDGAQFEIYLPTTEQGPVEGGSSGG